jgi:hypothetical protein
MTSAQELNETATRDSATAEVDEAHGDVGDLVFRDGELFGTVVDPADLPVEELREILSFYEYRLVRRTSGSFDMIEDYCEDFSYKSADNPAPADAA